MEPMATRVGACNMEAQGLIQGSAPGVDISKLEADLEPLNEKWGSLNEKV
jgi:hypothetical protein